MCEVYRIGEFPLQVIIEWTWETVPRDEETRNGRKTPGERGSRRDEKPPDDVSNPVTAMCAYLVSRMHARTTYDACTHEADERTNSAEMRATAGASQTCVISVCFGPVRSRGGKLKEICARTRFPLKFAVELAYCIRTFTYIHTHIRTTIERSSHGCYDVVPERGEKSRYAEGC